MLEKSESKIPTIVIFTVYQGPFTGNTSTSLNLGNNLMLCVHDGSRFVGDATAIHGGKGTWTRSINEDLDSGFELENSSLCCFFIASPLPIKLNAMQRIECVLCVARFLGKGGVYERPGHQAVQLEST